MKRTTDRTLKTRDAFTLVELLVVIAILAFLLAFTTLGVTSLGSSSRINNAGNQVVDLVDQARQIARARNVVALLVIAKEASTEPGAETVLFTLCERRGDSSAWKQIHKWDRLPTGVRIDESKSRLDAQAVTPALPTLKHGARSLSPSDYHYQAFLPDGRLLADENPVIHVTSLTAPDNFYRIVVNTATGIPIIERP